MINLDKKEINFIGHRKVFLIISLVLVLCSFAVLGIKGLSLSTEFVGGTTITYMNAQDGTTEQSVRDALSDAGYTGEATVQTTSSNGNDGFLARIDSTDITQSNSIAEKSAETLGVSKDDVQIASISPSWGSSVIKSSIMAFVVGIILIMLYVWIRFRDVKMGATAVVALLHDMIIVIGVYALFGRELTPNTIAALLTIMGYSLYDTIVTFHSINDNAASGKLRQNFWTISNHAINQVIVRTMNTTITSLVPVLFMLVLGGSTLVDFAFPMAIGLIIGSYSSVALASPIYAIWKSHEEKVAKLNKKFGSEVNLDTESILGYEKGVDNLQEFRASKMATA